MKSVVVSLHQGISVKNKETVLCHLNIRLLTFFLRSDVDHIYMRFILRIIQLLRTRNVNLRTDVRPITFSGLDGFTTFC